MDHLKAAVCFSAMRVFTASISFAHHEEFGDIRSSHVVCSYQNRVVAYEYVTLPERLGDRTHRAGDEHKKAVYKPVYAWAR